MKTWLVDGYIGWMAAAWVFILVLVVGNIGIIITDFWELARDYSGVLFSLCFAVALPMFTGFTGGWLGGLVGRKYNKFYWPSVLGGILLTAAVFIPFYISAW